MNKEKNKGGYYGIGVYNIKTEMNLGTLWRSADNFGASFIFTIGKRYKRQASDTTKAYRHIPLYHYEDFNDFNKNRPFDCKLVGIEQTNRAKDITEYNHPERAIYLLGAEDYGLPEKILDKCQDVVFIDTPKCLNVAVAGSIVMFSRNSHKRII